MFGKSLSVDITMQVMRRRNNEMQLVELKWDDKRLKSRSSTFIYTLSFPWPFSADFGTRIVVDVCSFYNEAA